MKKKILVGVVVVMAVAVMWVVSPIGTGQNYLSEVQKYNLCEALAGDVSHEDYYDNLGFEVTATAAINVMGVQKNGDEFYVYGQEYDGEFVSFKGAAYETSGGCGDFMVKIRCNGDDVDLVKVYGDNVTTQATWDAMPLRYRLKAQLLSGEYGYEILEQELYKKVEARLGVPVDSEYQIDITDDMIEVATWADDHIEYKYRETIIK